MTESIIEFFRNLLGNDYATVFVISMIPIIELRGAIPVAVKAGMNIFQGFGCAYAGSCIVAPILLLLLQPILNAMKKTRVFRSLAMAVESGFQGKADKVNDNANKFDATKIERKRMLGVFGFVALPIPMTGVWTGSAVAVFTGLSFWKSLSMIWIGNFIAGTIIALLSYFCQAYIDYILWGFFGIVVIVFALVVVRTIIKMINQKKDNNK